MLLFFNIYSLELYLLFEIPFFLLFIYLLLSILFIQQGDGFNHKPSVLNYLIKYIVEVINSLNYTCLKSPISMYITNFKHRSS